MYLGLKFRYVIEIAKAFDQKPPANQRTEKKCCK